MEGNNYSLIGGVILEDDSYRRIHGYPKLTNKQKLFCAAQGKQEIYNGHAIFNEKETFKVIQARKGHIRQNDLSYVLLHKASEIMVRVDIIGATHEGVPTPHIHIYDEEHNQGEVAIPLSQIANYNITDSIIDSLAEFLKFNNFDLTNNQISQRTV